MMMLKKVTTFVRKYSLTPAILEQFWMYKILNKSISAVVSKENMAVRIIPKSNAKYINLSVNFNFDG